jgi:hypothetical protein
MQTARTPTRSEKAQPAIAATVRGED